MIKLLLATLISYCQMANAFSLKIVNDSNYPISLEQINETFSKASTLFENNFGPVNQEITVNIDSKNCLRTGYNFKDNQIHFCKNSETIEMGLNSIDVINHEFFHAFLCNFKNSLCQENLNIAAHEGLADYFAYLLNPDKCFGEKFYPGAKCVRSYNTTFRLGYVEDDHAIGNVLAKNLIENQTILSSSLELFNSNLPANQIYENLFGRSKSEKNKYRLAPMEKFKIEFTFENNEKLKLKWSTKGNLIIYKTNESSYEISIPEKSKAQIAIVYFLNDISEIIGYKKYYFGNKIDKPN